MKKVKKKLFEIKEKKHKKDSMPSGIEEMLQQMAEIIYHSYFNKFPHELEKLVSPRDDVFFTAA